MDTQPIVLDREKARELWQAYKLHQHYSQPIDRDVMHVYQAMAKGKVVIRALESIRAAGLGEDKLPKLAIAPADAKFCYLNTWSNGSVRFSPSEQGLHGVRRRVIDMPPGSFPGIDQNRWRPRSTVPQIPLPIRPKRALAAYHILYEAEWSLVPPVDPMLLRRVGQTDMWLVVAAWDLTEVERAALAAHTARV